MTNTSLQGIGRAGEARWIMAKVFLSYAREDEAHRIPIFQQLTNAGHEVWWDYQIGPGLAWDRQIEDALDACDYVVVLWTKRSVEREFVRDEARRGLEAQKLIQLKMEDCRIPIGFGARQWLDLQTWRAEEEHPGWHRALAWLATSPLASANGEAGPDQDALTAAFACRARLNAALQHAEMQPALQRYLRSLDTTIASGESYLRNRRHTWAFVGDIGVGKSSAINTLLVTERGQNGPLPVGGGATTLCPIEIQHGETWTLRVTPAPEAEVRALAKALAHAAWLAADQGQPDDESQSSLPTEVKKALRNMADLAKNAEGDPLVTLARNAPSINSLTEQVIDRLDHTGRSTTSFVPDKDPDRERPLVWLRETLKKINLGQMPGAPFPETIAITLPLPRLKSDAFEITLLDTKGIDQIAVRPDFVPYLSDTRTTLVLSSGFVTAPAVSLQAFMNHARETSGRYKLQGKFALLMLPKYQELLRVLKHNGDPVANADEGRAIKVAEVESALHQQHPLVPVGVFHSEEDDAEVLTQFLFAQTNRLRASARTSLDEAIKRADVALANTEVAAFQASLDELVADVSCYLQANAALPSPGPLAFAPCVASQYKVAHVRTIHGAMLKRGCYAGLDFPTLVAAYGASRAMAASTEWMKAFCAHLDALAQKPDLQLARDALTELKRRADLLQDHFIGATRQAALELFSGLTDQEEPWSTCVARWGQGLGYTDFVVTQISNLLTGRADLTQAFAEKLADLWSGRFIGALRQLVERNTDALLPGGA